MGTPCFQHFASCRSLDEELFLHHFVSGKYPVGIMVDNMIAKVAHFLNKPIWEVQEMNFYGENMVSFECLVLERTFEGIAVFVVIVTEAFFVTWLSLENTRWASIEGVYYITNLG